MPWPDRSSFRQFPNYLFAVGSELAAPLLRGADLVRRRSAPTPPDQWRHILLAGHHHIGDVLYTTSGLPALRAGLPGARLHFLAPQPACAVLEGNPCLASVVDPTEVEARAAEFDAAICYSSIANWRELFLTWRLGLPNRAAYANKGFSALVTHPLPIRRPQPYANYFQDLVAALTGRPVAVPPRPLVYPGAAHRAEAEGFFARHPLAAGPRLACFFTSRQRSGVWPLENFGRVLQELHARRPEVQCVIFGAGDEAARLGRFGAGLGFPVEVSAGELSLLGLAETLRHFQLVFCTDSGPRHLANAAGPPVCFVPNLAVGKIETGKYLDSETDLIPEFELVPAGEQPAVFAKIPPARLAEQLMQRLPPPAAGA